MTITKSQPIRQLNQVGIREFKVYLAALRAGHSSVPFPHHVLTDDSCSELMEPARNVVERPFVNRREAGEYLSDRLGQFRIEEVRQNWGLWSWLGMFYFDHLVRKDENGNPLLGRNPDVAYVIDPLAQGRGERRYFAHRLLLAYETYTLHGENAWYMLDQPVNSVGQLADRLIGKPVTFRSQGIVKLAHLLYTDQTTRHTKPRFGGGGRENQRSPGNLMRFIDVLDQLYMTYDVYGMTAEELMKLLPAEFDRWLPNEPSSNSESNPERTSRSLASFIPSIRRRQ